MKHLNSKDLANFFGSLEINQVNNKSFMNVSIDLLKKMQAAKTPLME